MYAAEHCGGYADSGSIAVTSMTTDTLLMLNPQGEIVHRVPAGRKPAGVATPFRKDDKVVTYFSNGVTTR